MNSISFDDTAIYPSKIICIGRNYAAHIEELDNEVPEQAVIFIKPNSSISDEIIANKNDSIHFEGEISFLIKHDEIKGVGFGLDLTKREIQARLKSKGLPWERAKAFDGAAVFSEFVPFSGDFHNLRMELFINSTLTQSGGCSLMLHKPDEILSEIKSFLSLEDGDVIMTGTPKGVGPIVPGDTFTGKIYDDRKLIVEGHWEVR